MPTDLKRLIEKAEGFIVLRMPVEAWQALEDLPSEAKNLLAAAIKTGPERVRGKGNLKPWRQIKPIDRTCASTQHSSRSSHFAWTINWTDVTSWPRHRDFVCRTVCITILVGQSALITGARSA
jgi:hypothetical protein